MKITKTKRRLGISLLLLVMILIIACLPTPPLDSIQYYERKSGQLMTEKVAGEKWLIWLYYNPIGEATLWALAKRKMVSSIYGKMMDRSSSARKVRPFINDFDIDMSGVQEQEFNNFNDFFTRELKENARPVDYHRFLFPVSGNLTSNLKVDGDYYSVNPFALRKKAEILCLNKREYTILSNPLFGEVIMAEVGATMVGSIVQTYKGSSVIKGEEKGYFKFGGSTVVLLFEKNRISIDRDLLINTANGYETAVKMGERIGEDNNTKGHPG